ncbi:MAG: glycosyltransferase family 39 protein [Clostridia bacterium]
MNRFKRPRASLWVALFFLALTLIGLFTCGDYGLPCDEPAEQVILRQNMMEYAIRFLGENSSAAQYYDGLGIVPISQSIERDHGECAFYLAAPLLTLQASAPETLTLLWHMLCWLWFMVGAFALYGFCRETGLNRLISCAGALLLCLCPRFFAEGHYNNKDLVLLSLVLATLWLGLRFLKKPNFLRGLLFSLAGAMASNTKVVGIFAWGLMGLCTVLLLVASKRFHKRMAAVAAVTIGSFVLFYALLTPACWGQPMDYLRYLLLNASGFTRWPGVVLFRGALYEHAISPLPRYYLPYMMLVTLPLYLPVLAVLGQFSTLRRVWRQKSAALRDETTLALLAATLLWLVPLLFAAFTRPLVYNGWRHFYFVFAGVSILAAQGVGAVWRFCVKRAKAAHARLWRRLLPLTLCACFAVSAWGIAANHPYQYGYYNVLARGNAQNEMELDYWVVSTLNAMKRLISEPRNQALPLKLGARDDMSWFGVAHGAAVLPKAQREALSVAYEPDAPYLLENTTYAKIYATAPPQGYHVLFTVQSYGNVLCTVYERDGALPL